MSEPPSPYLDYAPTPRSRGGWRNRLVAVLAAYPIVTLVLVYAIWLTEYAANGGPPGPREHGADHRIGRVAYGLAELACGGGCLAVGPLTLLLCVTIFAGENDRRPRPPAWDVWRWWLPPAAWAVAGLWALWDPHGVVAFFIDW